MGSMIVSLLFYGSIGDVIILTLFRKIRKASTVAATPVASHSVFAEERTLYDVVSGILYYTELCSLVSIICKSGFVSMR